MSRIIAILTLMLVGGVLAGPSCNSCGRECAPACGTRYFRSCCFNYLRKKRGPDAILFPTENLHDWKEGKQIFEDGAELWGLTPSDFELYHINDRIDNRLHNMYM